MVFVAKNINLPYSLGDAIDWKLHSCQPETADEVTPLLARGRDRLETRVTATEWLSSSFPYSLGDAIDWKLSDRISFCDFRVNIPLLARGRDRLETLRLVYY